MDRVVTVVTALNNVPYMRNAVLCEVVMVALRCAESYNVVRSTSGDEYQIRSFVRIAPLEGSRCTGCRADSSDIAELVAVLHTDLE